MPRQSRCQTHFLLNTFACLRVRETLGIQNSPGLLRVSLFMHHDNCVGVYQAVRHESQRRRRNLSTAQVKVGSLFDQKHQLILLLHKIVDDVWVNDTTRRLKYVRCFQFLCGFRRQIFNEHPSEESWQNRKTFPKSARFLPFDDLLDYRKVRFISCHQMVKALSDAPAFGIWLLVELLCGQIAKCLLRFGNDITHFCNQVG